MGQEQSYQKRMKKIAESMDRIGHKIAVISGKGGVGKTTVAVNLAYALSLGSSVGLLDTDITGPNVPKMLGMGEQRAFGSKEGMVPPQAHGIKVVSMAFLLDGEDTPVIWRGPLRGSVILQFLSEVAWGDLDYLIIDLPPGTGDEALSIAQAIPSLSGAVIVTTPQEVSLLDSRKAIRFAQRLNVKVLGVIENMSGLDCPVCGHRIDLFKAGGGEKAAAELKVPFLGRIPIESHIVTTADQGKPFIAVHPESVAAQSFSTIVERIRKEVNR